MTQPGEPLKDTSGPTPTMPVEGVLAMRNTLAEANDTERERLRKFLADNPDMENDPRITAEMGRIKGVRNVLELLDVELQVGSAQSGLLNDVTAFLMERTIETNPQDS